MRAGRRRARLDERHRTARSTGRWLLTRGVQRSGNPGSTTAVLCGVLASGCAAPPLYDWGNYEKSLQDSYISHDEAQTWSDLEAAVTTAQQTGRRIPPGACAEYGFSLYRRGQRKAAIEYFQREAQLFPESKPLMDKLITKIDEQNAAEEQPSSGGDSVQ